MTNEAARFVPPYELLRAAESIPPSAQLKLSAAGIILDWNTAAGKLLRIAPEQVLGGSLFDLLAPYNPFSRIKLLQAFKHAVDGSPNGVRLAWQTEGDALKLELYAVRDRDGKLTHVSLLIMLDSTPYTSAS